MSVLNAILDVIWPRCASGLNHRVTLLMGTVDNGRLCWHPDCLRLATLEGRLDFERVQGRGDG